MKYIAIALLCAASIPAGTLTPAGKAIDAAQAAIQKEPQNFEHHNALALAYARRAREVADHAWYDRASESLRKSLELSPDNFGARKIECWVLLGQHQFADALKAAKALLKRSADDEMVYGLLTDAHVQLGNYADAEDAAQWMLNIGRSSIPGLTRAAFLRELFGDIEGALELMNQAFHRTNPAETEDRAWLLTHIGHLYAVGGKNEAAVQVVSEALRLMPDYHYALAALAKLRQVEGRHEEAVVALRRRYESAPHPENLFDLAAAVHKAGRSPEAKKLFSEFERKALAESEGGDNANHELVTYYADYASNSREAVRIAKMEAGRRQDVYTLDALAWALHRNGRSREAMPHIERALSVGTVDPRLLYHAGAIAVAAGRQESAKKYLQRSLEVNSRSEVASDVKRLLARSVRARLQPAVASTQ
jgi:tetratricopeptide (TPR) repeat protein